MRSIRAVDGTVLNFVSPKYAEKLEVYTLRSRCRNETSAYPLLESMDGDRFEAMQEVFDKMWFIRRSNEKAYCGVCYFSVDEDSSTIYPTVIIAPEYRGNGYGRAAVIAMCTGTHAHNIGYIDRSSKFCESLGMTRNSRDFYTMRTADLIHP